MSAEMDITIEAEDGVLHVPAPKPKRRSRERSPRIQGYVDAFAKFRPGQSFFVPGVKRKDVEFLRQPFVDAGLGVVFREVEMDEIHLQSGVRIWRQAGPLDFGTMVQPQRPQEKLKGKRVSKKPTTPKAKVLPPDYDPDLDDPLPSDDDDEL